MASNNCRNVDIGQFHIYLDAILYHCDILRVLPGEANKSTVHASSNYAEWTDSDVSFPKQYSQPINLCLVA